MDTPVFDATVEALTAPQTGPSQDPEASNAIAWPNAECIADTDGTILDPDTPEGVAILSLFGRLKSIEEGDGSWPGGDAVQELTGWFANLGIYPEDEPTEVEHRLRAAAREIPGGGANSSFGVRICTDHNDPEMLVRTALHVLVRQLGPGTSIDLITHDRNVGAHIEHRRTASSD